MRFSIAIFGRNPSFNVIFFCGYAAYITCANVDDSVVESEALVKAADMALLKAKKWRNRVCVFEGFKLE